MTFPELPGVSVPPPVHRAPASPHWLWAGTLLLVLNLGLAAWTLHTQAVLAARLARLEAGTRPALRAPSAAGLSGGERATSAGRQERIAFLLAASADAQETRHVLEVVSPGECVEMAQVVLARAAANDRNAALSALLQKITEDRPGEAVRLMAAVPEAALRNTLAGKIALTWIERDPAGAAGWLGTEGTPFLARDSLARTLRHAVTRWAAFDPASAARFVASRPLNGDAGAQLLRAASREWAHKDPAAALAWTQNLPAAEPARPPATYGVLEGWTDVQPVQAAGYVGQLNYSSAQGYAGEAAAVAARWTENDPAAASQWASGLHDRAARRDATQQVAATWAVTDPSAAARWAVTLPDSRQRGEIWQGLAGVWADTDSAAAEQWLGNLPAGSSRDAAVAAYVDRIGPGEPEKALTWLKTFTDPALGAQRARRILSAWSRQDALAARNWISANPLPAFTESAVR